MIDGLQLTSKRPNSDIRNRNITGVCLHTDISGGRINARRISARVGCCAPEACRFLSVEPDDVLLILYFDFVVVPPVSRQILSIFVILLPFVSAECLDFVNSSGATKELAIRFVKTSVAASFFINLDFKSGVHCHEGSIASWVD